MVKYYFIWSPPSSKQPIDEAALAEIKKMIKTEASRSAIVFNCDACGTQMHFRQVVEEFVEDKLHIFHWMCPSCLQKNVCQQCRRYFLPPIDGLIDPFYPTRYILSSKPPCRTCRRCPLCHDVGTNKCAHYLCIQCGRASLEEFDGKLKTCRACSTNCPVCLRETADLIKDPRADHKGIICKPCLIKYCVSAECTIDEDGKSLPCTKRAPCKECGQNYIEWQNQNDAHGLWRSISGGIKVKFKKEAISYWPAFFKSAVTIPRDICIKCFSLKSGPPPNDGHYKFYTDIDDCKWKWIKKAPLATCPICGVSRPDYGGPNNCAACAPIDMDRKYRWNGKKWVVTHVWAKFGARHKWITEKLNRQLQLQ